jgi:hypothetical protein
MKTLAAMTLLGAFCASASAQDVNFYTPLGLDGLQESPPVVTTGTGSGTAFYDESANTLTVHVEFSGLIGIASDAHIHCCFVDRVTSPNASVALGFTTAGFPFGGMSGVYDHTFDLGLNATYTSAFRTANGGTANGARDALLAGMASGHAYFNIHTGNFRPGGEIRGDIFQVPEPASMMLLACGIAIFGVRRRVR